MEYEAMEYFRELLHIPPEVFPSALTRQRAVRAALARADTAAASGDGCKGEGEGKGEGKCGEGE